MGEREVIACESEAEARAKIAALRRESARTQTDRAVSTAVAAYLAHRIDEGYAPRAIETDRHRLRGLLRFVEHDRSLRELTPAVARQLYTRRRGEVAVDTHQGELVVAGRFTAWCVEQGWIARDSFADVEPSGRKRAGRGKPQLRVDEGRVLMDYLLERLGVGVTPELVAVLTALLLGPRASEVVTRDVRDLDDRGRLLWIPDSKTDSGRRTLEVPEVLQPFLRALARGRRGVEPLFVATDAPHARRKFGRRRATRHWLAYHCERLCELAGVPSISPHGLRRSHGSIARAAGATAELVAAQLGHASTAVQRRSYVAVGAAEAGETRTVLRLLRGGQR